MICGGKKKNIISNSPSPKDVSLAIDRKMVESKRREVQKLKFLLLGTGESGKSTIFKQFRILYGQKTSTDDLRMYGVVVRSNIISAVTKLCELTRELNVEDRLKNEGTIQVGDGSNMAPSEAYDNLLAHLVDNNAPEPLPPPESAARDWVGNSMRAGNWANADAEKFLQLAHIIEAFWSSQTIREYVWRHGNSKNLNDSHIDFMNQVRTIASPRYVPSESDVLKARVRTTQVNVEKYLVDRTELEVCDVGGQRSERRKWIGCFDNVTAVVFVAALSEYDQRLAEARTQNRMIEALNLFESIVNNEAFDGTPVMLFLNKKDIFKQKLSYSNIADVTFFSEYSGPKNDFDHGVLYFIQKFEERMGREFQDSFLHVTNATDSDAMEFVLNATRLIILEINFERVFGNKNNNYL